MKKLKSIIIAILILIPATSVFAQSTSTKKFELYRDNVLLLEHDLGVNINTFKPKGNIAAELMGDRVDVGFRESSRISYLFAPRWGAYASFGVSVYGIDDPYFTVIDIFDILAVGLVKSFHFDVEAGAIYRIEHKNWQFYPRVGIGYNGIYRETIGEESYTQRDYGKVDICPWYLAFSVNAAYRVSSLISWVFDVSYHQPITASKSFLYTYNDSDTRNRYDYKTHGWGRDWNISLGIRLNINLGGMKTSKIIPTPAP